MVQFELFLRSITCERMAGGLNRKLANLKIYGDLK
jgi:hypothetical protein